jgi:hypothetical protein
MDIKPGDTVTVRGETLTVVKISKNTLDRPGPVIIWKGQSKSEGGCVPSLWKEWEKGPRKRPSQK